MNITGRTCSNCAAFNSTPTDNEPLCWNLVSFLNSATPEAPGRDPRPTDFCENHQTAEEDAAQIHEIEVARQIAESTPEFLAAMSACLDLVNTLGQDHPDATLALMRAMALAPPSMHKFVATQAHELGLVPEADGYTDAGEPVFSLEAIAAKLGIGMEEAKESMQSMLAAREDMGLPNVLIDPATVHRRQ